MVYEVGLKYYFVRTRPCILVSTFEDNVENVLDDELGLVAA